MMNKPFWIVISGMPGRSSIALGKSSLSNALQADIAAQTKGLCVYPVPFAKALKGLVARASVVPGIEQVSWFYHVFANEWRYPWEPSLQAAYEAKAAMYDYPLFPGVKPRKLLQVMGTDVCRKLLSEDVWVHRAYADAQAAGADVVISDDCRFDNEATFNELFAKVGRGFPLLHIGIDASRNAPAYAANCDQLDPSVLFGEHASETSLTREPDLVISPRWSADEYAVLLAQVLTRIGESRTQLRKAA